MLRRKEKVVRILTPQGTNGHVITYKVAVFLGVNSNALHVNLTGGCVISSETPASQDNLSGTKIIVCHTFVVNSNDTYQVVFQVILVINRPEGKAD